MPQVTFTRGVQGGVPCIGGTRIPISIVAALTRDRGMTDENIVAIYPGLTAEDVQHVRWFDAHYEVRRRRKSKPPEPTR